MILENCWK